MEDKLESHREQPLIIWGRKSSFNVQKVMWLVDELGLEHEHIPVGGHFGGLDTAAFLAMNPHKHIPVISDKGSIVWESHAILRYLAARYGQSTFWSEHASTRALFDGWMDWSQTTLQPDFLMGVFWEFYRTPEASRNWSMINASIARCNVHFHVLENQLKDKKFLCGDSISLADIPVGTTLYRYFELEIERPYLPHVEAWYRRLQERPAYRKQVMIPFVELKGRLDF